MFSRIKPLLSRIHQKLSQETFGTPWLGVIIVLALLLSIASTSYFLYHDQLVAYGDSESHLNIAKRVVDSLTPGMAQLGGIWLPLPHLMLVPFVAIDPLWRSGLAGAIVSGICYIVTAVYLYKIVWLLTKQALAGFAAFLAFGLNPNVLYLQSTAMTEVPLMAFFVLSTYYFLKFLRDDQDLLALVLAGVFGFAATLTRYDGWFLVLFEAVIIGLHYLPKWIKNRNWKNWQTLEGSVLLFSTLAFFGIGLWLLWDYLILGDPFYFTSSPFSAKSQQQGWLARGELPTYHNLWLSLLYYAVTSVENTGYVVSAVAIAGIFLFLVDRKQKQRGLFLLLSFVPFLFYVTTLYAGQSVIFIPSLTPDTYEWQLFNVRYGMMMIPVVAIFCAYVINWMKYRSGKILIIGMIILQSFIFFSGRAAAISWQDGTRGLSASKRTDAERWFKINYDEGLVLFDDFSRTISIVRSGIPMESIIYVGNKPYWEESLEEPEKYATWIVMQENDSVWKNFLGNPEREGRLYKHFQKAYTSPTILIFKRNQ